MSRVIDFHSHILPGIDDGSTCVEESIAMLKMEAEQGIRHVIATPHFYPRHDRPERFLRRRKEAEARLREEMEKHTGLPQVSVGAEVHFFSGISHSDILSALTIDQKKCILIEMPHIPWTEKMYRELEDIREECGLTPILAHLDRYIGPLRTHGIPERVEQLPVLVQANAGFFLRRTTAGMALRMLKEDRIHLLGSDCHNLEERSPNLGFAVQKIQQRLGTEAISRVNQYEAEVLSIL